jgi:hypothetical protein
MNILFAAKHIESGDLPIGGVQSWIKTMRAEFERKGHSVTEWQRDMALPKQTFDLGVLANGKYTAPVVPLCARKIGVCHGIVPDEAPANGMDKYYYVSENVRDHWNSDGPILRQPIDLDFWHDAGREREGVVRYSYRDTPTHCPAAAKALGMSYRQVANATHEQARDILQRAKIVFATGRAALEAAACGAPVVIYDNRSTYQPALLDTDFERQMQFSYSGRGGVEPTLADVVQAARSAKPMRHWVEQHHDVRNIVSRLYNAR